jgi:hypothetical protein
LLDVVHHLREEEVDPPTLLGTGQAAVDPVVQGDEGDPKDPGDLFAGQEGFFRFFIGAKEGARGQAFLQAFLEPIVFDIFPCWFRYC